MTTAGMDRFCPNLTSSLDFGPGRKHGMPSIARNIMKIVILHTPVGWAVGFGGGSRARMLWGDFGLHLV